MIALGNPGIRPHFPVILGLENGFPIHDGSQHRDILDLISRGVRAKRGRIHFLIFEFSHNAKQMYPALLLKSHGFRILLTC